MWAYIATYTYISPAVQPTLYFIRRGQLPCSCFDQGKKMKVFALVLLGLVVADAASITDVKKELLRELLLRGLSGSKGDDSSPDSSSEQTVHEQILGMEELYMKYFKTQDYVALSNLYTDDAYYSAPGQDPVFGKKAISESVWVPGKGGNKENKEELFFESKNIYDGGEIQIGYGYWHVNDNPDVTDSSEIIADGQYMTVYKNVGGKWLILMDIINTTHMYRQPPPAEDGKEDFPGENLPEEGSDAATKRKMVEALESLLYHKQ